MQREYVGLRMQPELVEAIDKLAAEQGRNRSNMIEFIISGWIKEKRPEMLPQAGQ
jgi:metal-responsive CopG/Arc/MetJ family transcriptional regulator